MTNNLNNHKSKYLLIYYIGGAIIGVGITQFAYTTVKSFTSPSKYIGQSYTYKASGNYKAALDALNTAIKLDSKNPQLYIERAEVRDKLGDESGVIEDYKKAIQINPNSKDNYLFHLIWKNSDHKAQLQYVNLAIQIDPNNSRCYIYRAAIQLNAKNAVYYDNRAWVRYDLGDKQAAIKDWQQAANLYLQQGDTKKYSEAIKTIKLFQLFQ